MEPWKLKPTIQSLVFISTHEALSPFPRAHPTQMHFSPPYPPTSGSGLNYCKAASPTNGSHSVGSVTRYGAASINIVAASRLSQRAATCSAVYPRAAGMKQGKNTKHLPVSLREEAPDSRPQYVRSRSKQPFPKPPLSIYLRSHLFVGSHSSGHAEVS